MTTLDPLHLWGKTTKAGDNYHPALYHMVDVAQAARALLSPLGPARVREALFGAWDGGERDGLAGWLPFSIALHDIGKLSTPFQGQQSTPEARLQRERLQREGFPLGTDGDAPPTHSAISAWWLQEQLRTLEPGLGRNALLAIRDAAGGHHGTFATGLKDKVAGYMELHEPPVWNDLRRQGYTLLRSALGPASGSLAEIGSPRRLRPATAALTGLTVIADWVASNTEFFPSNQWMPFDQYIAHSLDRACNALVEIGLAAERPARPYAGFEATFNQAPRGLQEKVDALASEDLRVPGLFIIEAPTGEGKTEAALALARRLAAHGASDEIYIGLPTMATSNQMFGRVERFFTELYGDLGAVRLAHGQAALMQSELRRAARLAQSHGDADPAAQRGAWAASDEQALRWFVGSKRALLAPFGVGTVDQVELAGLNVRHAILRLFGLAGKVVVLDEVHAYDTYMSTILEHTLRWLASMGTSVILLSATLPHARRQALTQSYMAGLRGVEPRQVAVDISGEYPVLALSNASHARQIPLPTARRVSLALRFVSDDGPQQAQRLLDLTACGGAVARICNRVDDAQQIYEELKRQRIPNLTLIHARFPLDERLEREQRIAALVGKETRRTPGERLIIIGTQVLEQSLDYDVDVMVTDLCPIDLLLQRAGRLHRHDRPRPDAHRQPTLYIQHLTRPDGLPELARWQRIYAPLVLWHTWLTLRARLANDAIPVELPADYRPLIEAVYGDAPQATTSNATWDAALAAAAAALAKSQASERAQAHERLTPEPRSSDSLAVERAQFVEDEEGQLTGWQIAKTRLGERITVIPLYQVGGGWALVPGGAPLGQIEPDDIATQRKLLDRSLPISDRRVVAYLRDKVDWRQKKIPPLLKYTPPLLLDANGRATVAGVALRLDADLGLVIGKEEA